jgi:hypothetical protein
MSNASIASTGPSTATHKRVLHVGCGPKRIEKLHETFRSAEWQEVRVDIDARVQPDIVASITAMPQVASASVDAVWSSHNLEHLYAHEVPRALAEFLRVLKPGGFVLVTMPDMQRVAEYILQGNMIDPIDQSPAGPISPVDLCYGHRPSIARGNEFMAHRTGFTAHSLTQQLTACGFCSAQTQRDHLNLWGLAFKPGPLQPTAKLATRGTRQ